MTPTEKQHHELRRQQAYRDGEIKPCPFCGCNGYRLAFGVIECNRCQARIPGEDNADAIAAWNRRI